MNNNIVRSRTLDQEEDVWGFMRKPEQITTNPKQRKHYLSSSSSSKCKSSSSTTTPKMIPKGNTNTIVHQQSSAPIDIPDWSKIYGKKKVMKENSKFGSWVDRENNDYDGKDDNFDENDDDDDDQEMIPPHEWLAKKLARSQISSFSVCEGIGRTLKGRDLSEVRNAILTKTGFLEQ